MTRRNTLALTLGVTLITVAAAALPEQAPRDQSSTTTPVPAEAGQFAARSGYIVASS